MNYWRSMALGGTLAVVATGAVVAASIRDSGVGTAGSIAPGGGVPGAVPGGGMLGAVPGVAVGAQLGGGELDAASRNDGEVEQESRSLTASAVQGSLNDFWNGKVLSLGEGVWLLDRQMDFSLIVEQDDGRLIAIHSDEREPSEAIIHAGSPDVFLSYGGAFEAGGNDSDLDDDSLCTGVLPCQDTPNHTWWCTCMSRCDCGTERGSVCCFHVVDEPGVSAECSYKCCDDDDTAASEQQADNDATSNPCLEVTPE